MHLHSCSPWPGRQLLAGQRSRGRIGRGGRTLCTPRAGASQAHRGDSRGVPASATAASPAVRAPDMAAAFDARRLNPAAVESLPPDTAQHFSGLLAVQSSLLSTISERLGVEPQPEGEFTGALQASSLDGKASTCIQTFGGKMLARLTTGWAAFNFPAPTGLSRLTAWVDESIDAPHLTIELIYYGDTGLLWTHLFPRKDAVLDWAYIDRHYGQPPPGCPRSWVALDADCRAREGWRPFKSSQPLVRLVGAGLEIGYWLPPDGLAAAGEVAREAVDMWLALVESAAPVPEGERYALRTRDLALRRSGAWGDAPFLAMEKVFGTSALERLGRLLTGAPRPQQ